MEYQKLFQFVLPNLDILLCTPTFIYTDTVMPPRFQVIYLSLVALVCTLVGAKDPELAQSFQETVQQIDALKEPVEEFAHNIQDVAQVSTMKL